MLEKLIVLVEEPSMEVALEQRPHGPGEEFVGQLAGVFGCGGERCCVDLTAVQGRRMAMASLRRRASPKPGRSCEARTFLFCGSKSTQSGPQTRL